MSSIRETAEQIVDQYVDDQFMETRRELKLAVESALKTERERAAKIVKSFDLSMWVKDGGKLREIFAEAILDENRE